MTDHQDNWAREADAAASEARAKDRRRLAAVAAAVSVRQELARPAGDESASIVELTAISREAREEVEDHRRMVQQMGTTGHRQRAIACILDKMTYLELISFAEDLFGEQQQIDVACMPSHIARWARRAKE